MRREENYCRYPRAILWLVRGGEAAIGDGVTDAGPAFRISLESFYLSKFPVTNLQYEAYDPSYERRSESPADDDPAVGVDFEGAHGYCAWYARVSRKAMRLPTEVEWEYACRGGTDTRYFFGDDPAAGDAWVRHAGNSGDRVPRLRDTRPNPFGLHAMLGGIWEWTSSLYRPYPVIAGDDRDDPRAGGERVLRGGSFREAIDDLGCAVRRAADPALRTTDVGFRVARSLAGR